jgi:3-hydroxyacyl-[acyl-carrier-protein] dehydratase
MRWVFLDRIAELLPGEKARGFKGVAASEDFFADHFPGFPVLPGVLQIEALAQLSGKLIEVTVFQNDTRWVWPIISIVRKAKFRRFVAPGVALELTAELVELRDESAICKAAARLEGKVTTEAELVFVFNPGDLDTPEAQAKLERLERENLSILWPGYRAWDAAMRARQVQT